MPALVTGAECGRDGYLEDVVVAVAGATQLFDVAVLDPVGVPAQLLHISAQRLGHVLPVVDGPAQRRVGDGRSPQDGVAQPVLQSLMATMLGHPEHLADLATIGPPRDRRA